VVQLFCDIFKLQDCVSVKRECVYVCMYLIIEIGMCAMADLRNQRLRIGKRRRKSEFTLIWNCRKHVRIFRLEKKEVRTNNMAAALSVYKVRELHGGVPTHTITQSVYGAELNFLAQLKFTSGGWT